ncbi:MAG TPA: hypothetical protein VL098_14595 [Flavipsychrobacter sp.]|nr:hypothetical protein [Flavipsychrobacter sp.]
MTAKRKISIRKVLQAVFTLLLTGGCVAAILSASKIQETEKLKSISLHVRNENKYQFLDKQSLLASIKRKNHLIANSTTLNQIHLKAIEQQVYEDPWVAEAQVYIDNQRNMHIYATQHVPAARIFFENGQSYYLNDSLKLLPLSSKFTYYTTVVTNVPWFNNDSLNNAARAQIVSLVHTVEKDSFWNAQIEQITMTPDLEFEMYPVLGTHKILFGDTTAAERKFENLLGFYKTILNKIGWDRYELLDARYKDQIVASPALAWKMPAKGFISNMDWVKTIMATEPQGTSNTPAAATSITPATSTPSSTGTKATTPQKVTTSNNTTKLVPTAVSKPKPAATPPASAKPNTLPAKNTSNNNKPAVTTPRQEKPKTNTEKKSEPKPKYILN